MITQGSPSAGGILDSERRLESERSITFFAYVMHLAALVTFVTGIVGLGLNYSKRNAFSVPLGTHHAYMIRTLWCALPWFVIGCLTTGFFVGWFLLSIVWSWFAYRQMLGLIRLANDEPMML